MQISVAEIRIQTVITFFLLSVIYESELNLFELWHGISNNVVCANSKGSDQPGHTGSLIRAFASRLNTL